MGNFCFLDEKVITFLVLVPATCLVLIKDDPGKCVKVRSGLTCLEIDLRVMKRYFECLIVDIFNNPTTIYIFERRFLIYLDSPAEASKSSQV
jgi:hypothetical protein